MNTCCNLQRCGLDEKTSSGNIWTHGCLAGYIQAWVLPLGHRQCGRACRDVRQLVSVGGTKFFQHRCNNRPSAEITCGPASCSSLYLFDLEYILFGRGVPYGGGILQLGSY